MSPTSRPDLLIVCVDPGETSGIAAIFVTGTDVAKVHSDEVGGGYVRSEVEWLLARAPLDAERLLGVERFTASRKPGLSHQPAAQQLVGVVLDIGQRFRVEVVVQQPSDVKKLAKNELLKQLGWWHRGGEGHANDALRHCLRLLALRRASSYGRLLRPDMIQQTEH